MNSVIECYKFRFMIVSIIISFTVMHFFLNSTSAEISFERLIEFDVRKPFLYRILVPGAISYLASYINYYLCFFFIELAANFILYAGLYCLFTLFFSKQKSALFAVLGFLLLHFIYIINYRSPLGGDRAYFFSFDIPALAFLTFGLFFTIKRKWSVLYFLIIFATLNRETSLLIILLLPALYFGSRYSWKKPFIILLMIYGVIRLSLVSLFINAEGSMVEIIKIYYPYISHLRDNLNMLFGKGYFIWIFSEMAYLPLFWLWINHYIPRQLIRLKFVVLFYVLVLFVVGDISEARIWGEAAVLLYFPVILGISNWLESKPQLEFNGLDNKEKAEQYSVPIILALFFSCAIFLLSFCD